MSFITTNIKYIILMILLCTSTAPIYAQAGVYSISDMGLITIPEELELQGSKIFQLSESRRREIQPDYDYVAYDDKVIFQQRGLDSREPQSLDTYARVIIVTEKGEEGDYYSLKEEYFFSESDLVEISKGFRGMISQSLNIQNIKLIDWISFQQVVINGFQAIKTSFTRQLRDRPIVRVDIYHFHNNDMIHTVTTSYRVEESYRWQSVMTEVVNSIKIQNIR